VSRITVRQSLGNLERDGLIVRRRAKGTRVAEPRIEADLEQIRHQGYAASEAVRIEGYTLAAPVFDETGAAISAIGIGVNKHVPEEREVITRKLLETASRASSNAGFHAALLNA